MNSKLYKIRDYKLEDKAFIMATTLNGLWYGESWFSMIPKSVFMDNYKHIIEALVDNPLTVIKVACLIGDEDVILGYSILSTDLSIIHWVFVKRRWRKIGIARSLLPQYPTSVSHLSTVGKNLLYKFKNCIFNPFKLGV